ncbi:MAG: sulfatase-like hydrolase/transferase [Planctomycetales bacterium]|nr:sulfatase-like hydrolase/transferase [Planctomycetales bacterium]
MTKQCSLCAIILLLAFGVRHENSIAAERPNFLVILCDDLGYGDLGCFVHKSIKTPHLDKLAKEAIRFTDCYAAAPVCSASRAGLMTGRTPSRAGVYDWIPPGHVMHLRKEEVTIATLLRQAGYATCHVGKWHLNGKFNSKDQPQPGDHGFEYWMSTQNNAGPSHENPVNFVRNGQRVGPTQGYSCQVVVEEAIKWQREIRDPKKPFFQFVCFHEPHEPIASPPDLVAQYPDAKKEGEALYYANVTNMDRAVGKLLAYLDEAKLAENTIVFFTSDNGPETLLRYPAGWRSHGSPGPLRGMKLHVYDGGIRVPGILRWPARVKSGKMSSEPICNLDLLPTFCELAGVKPPQDRPLDGTSLVSLLDGKPLHRQQPLFWHYYRSISGPKAAMRIGDYMILGSWEQEKLPSGAFQKGDMEILKGRKLVSFELYNLVEDIGQKENLAEKEPQRLAEMRGKLEKVYTDVQNQMPAGDLLSTPPPVEKKKDSQ